MQALWTNWQKSAGFLSLLSSLSLVSVAFIPIFCVKKLRTGDNAQGYNS